MPGGLALRAVLTRNRCADLGIYHLLRMIGRRPGMMGKISRICAVIERDTDKGVAGSHSLGLMTTCSDKFRKLFKWVAFLRRINFG